MLDGGSRTDPGISSPTIPRVSAAPPGIGSASWILYAIPC